MNYIQKRKEYLSQQSTLDTFKSFINRSTSIEERKRISFIAKQILSPIELDALNRHIINFMDTEKEINEIKERFKKPFMFITHKRNWKKYNIYRQLVYKDPEI